MQYLHYLNFSTFKTVIECTSLSPLNADALFLSLRPNDLSQLYASHNQKLPLQCVLTLFISFPIFTTCFPSMPHKNMGSHCIQEDALTL